MDAWTIDTIKAVADPVARIAAVKQYDTQVVVKQREAHRIRDAAIVELLQHEGPAAVARRIGMSVSHVYNAKMRAE